MVKLRLAAILKRKKLSKRQFAKLIHVRYENVFRLFRPKYNPKLRTLEKYARALNVRLRDLFEE